jgi:oxygen tolerance protein BatD
LVMRARFASGLAIALAALTVRPAFADAPVSVSAALSEDHVQVGDVVTLEVTISAHVEGSVDLEVPEVDGLAEVSRSKSESTSIQFDGFNQRITKEYTIAIELEAQRAGRITIPPVTAKVGGHKAASSPLAIEVGGSATGGADAQAAEPGKIEPPSASEKNLFIRYVVDKASAYPGEQIILDLYVYANPQLNFGIEENAAPPTLDGFWREVLDQPQRLTRSLQVVAGRQYSVYRMWRIALFPLEAGTKTIPQAAIAFAVNRSIFGGGQRERRRTSPIKLEVKPLPTEGRPSKFFAGNVGSYTLSAAVDHDKVPAGKAIVLSIALLGRGNIKSAKLPELDSIPGFRVFQPTVNDDVKIDAAGVGGTKKAEILLMPESGGRLEIPAFDLAIFDPAKARYERLSTPSLRVVVEGDPAAIAAAAKAAAGSRASENAESNESDRPLAKDALRPLRFRSALSPHRAPPWRSPLFATLFAAPPILYALMLAFEQIRARARRETTATKKKRAVREARHRLEKASAATTSGEAAKAYAEFHEALIAFVLERSSLNLRGMTIEETKRSLLSRHASSDLVERIAKEMETADYARFAPGAIGVAQMSGALERWEQIFSDLERWDGGAHEGQR